LTILRLFLKQIPYYRLLEFPTGTLRNMKYLGLKEKIIGF
jgi:hypothetical protein